ncbi:CBO0543 family protein [Metabacillus litoralis]|uniref:CBO0543 family protein n=1 Tax=Metabacillus litoralis TaxID=152268 RepID=UPI00203EB62D|nr:CBO0543 family protein [Metabacillus litoralis]
MSMHIAIAILTIMASFKWGNWRNWREYHASMFFIATGGLLYEYIVKDYALWEFHPDLLYGQDMTVIIYALITMPVSIFLFLSHFPVRWFYRLLYILIWSGIYIAVEWILDVFGRISYQNGWEFGYSFLFDIIMFSVIALHQYYPFRAYILSVFIIIFLILYFKVPFEFAK